MSACQCAPCQRLAQKAERVVQSAVPYTPGGMTTGEAAVIVKRLDLNALILALKWFHAHP